jgi:hypothetical protein
MCTDILQTSLFFHCVINVLIVFIPVVQFKNFRYKRALLLK